jgi:hypothetical protein
MTSVLALTASALITVFPFAVKFTGGKIFPENPENGVTCGQQHNGYNEILQKK